MGKRPILLLSGVVAIAVLILLGSTPLVAEDAAGAEVPKYGGAKSCKKCHFAQHKSWKKTTLAKAFEVLKPDQAVEKKTAAKLDPKKDYTKDPKCLKCHTTAYGHASGYPVVKEGVAFTEEETTRAKLNEGVTCEACHGPGSLYGPFKKKVKEEFTKADIQKLGATTPVTADDCAHCHVKECPTMPADYKFDFEKTKLSDKLHKHKKLKREH